MRSLTFAEMMLEPEGTLYSVDYALPHRDPGLFRKGETWPERTEKGKESPEGFTQFDVMGQVAHDYGDDSNGGEFVYAESLEPEHRFLVLDADGIAALAAQLKL